jgi:benzodiazapine receptor
MPRAAASDPPSSTLRRDVMYAGLALLSVALASALSEVATYPNLAPWYENLVKPWFTAPNWVFAPIWTLLYLLMAFAFWRVLRVSAPARQRDRAAAIVAFYVVLVLNVAWSWFFFYGHSTVLGMADVFVQLIMIAGTIVLFARVNPLASLCLVPLLLWVGYANVLNIAIWKMNG